jgi:hypothetical protein
LSTAKSTFAVLRTGAYWRVLAPGETFRTYDYRIDAEEAALKLADRARESGEDTEVLLHVARHLHLEARTLGFRANLERRSAGVPLSGSRATSRRG